MLPHLRSSLLALLCAFASLTVANAFDDAKHAAKYEVEIQDEHGHGSSEVFDLGNPAHADKLAQLLANGKVHNLKSEHIPPIEQMFSLRWDLGLWSIIVFGGLLFILSKTAWPAMLQGLKKREQNIADAIAAAENAKNESEKIRQELTGEMAKASDNIRTMMEEARRDANAARDEMLNAAKKEIGEERDRQRREIENARDQALLDIWNQSTQLAAMLSAKTIKREIRPDDHKKLFDETLKEMRAAGKTGNS